MFGGWAAKGIAHFEALGVPVELLDVRTGRTPTETTSAERARRTSIVYFSGGNPGTSRASSTAPRSGRRSSTRLDDGLAFAGCSAGGACLTDRTYDSDTTDADAIIQPGLGPDPRGAVRARTGTCWTSGSRARATRSSRSAAPRSGSTRTPRWSATGRRGPSTAVRGSISTSMAPGRTTRPATPSCIVLDGYHPVMPTSALTRADPIDARSPRSSVASSRPTRTRRWRSTSRTRSNVSSPRSCRRSARTRR